MFGIPPGAFGFTIGYVGGFIALLVYGSYRLFDAANPGYGWQGPVLLMIVAALAARRHLPKVWNWLRG